MGDSQNKRPEVLYEDSETGCCKRFDPTPWDGRKVRLNNKLFIKDRVRSVFHIPLNFGKVMIRNITHIKDADALPQDPLMLVDENSLWGADVYIAVAKEVPEAENVRLSGTFRTKVFEGHFKNIKSWIKEMHTYVESKDEFVRKLYFYYTTCPKCAEHYGKNYVVIFAEVDEPEVSEPAKEDKARPAPVAEVEPDAGAAQEAEHEAEPEPKPAKRAKAKARQRKK